MIFKWIQFNSARYRGLDLAYATASGLKMSIGALMKAHKAGIIKKGLPDIVIPVAKGGYHGLYIELKKEKGITSPAQKEFIKRLCEEGYLAKSIQGYQDTINAIEGYFNENK